MREEGVAVRAGPRAVDVRIGIRRDGGIELADDRSASAPRRSRMSRGAEPYHSVSGAGVVVTETAE
jgi:hypothetical protein